MAYTHLKPGEELEISGYVYHGEGKTGVASLVILSMEELKQLEQDSMAKEKAIYQSMCDLFPSWIAQAKETVSIREAMEYLKTGPVEHTSNRWKLVDNYRREISNMVYKMVWWVHERSHYDVRKKAHVTDAWDLRWYLSYNTVQNPDKNGSGWQIAGQDSKVFKDKAAMDKYLQGRVNAYAHLFTEISPPIPKGEEGRFSVHGVLLPGYTVETTVDDLLALLDEEEGQEAPTPPPVPKKPPAHKHQKHTQTR